MSDQSAIANVSEYADGLRERLAVRGWVRPLSLMDDRWSSPAAQVLSPLSQEVETQATTRPGQWYLKADARRRILRSLTDGRLQELITARFAGDDDDPVRRAFENCSRPKPTHPRRAWHRGSVCHGCPVQMGGATSRSAVAVYTSRGRNDVSSKTA